MIRSHTHMFKGILVQLTKMLTFGNIFQLTVGLFHLCLGLQWYSITYSIYSLQTPFKICQSCPEIHTKSTPWFLAPMHNVP